MTKQLKFFIVFFGLVLLFSCKNSTNEKSSSPEKSIENKTNSLRFESKYFEKKGGECKQDHIKCVVIKLKYPVAIEGNEKTRNSINQFVNNMVLESIVPDLNENITDFNTASNQLLKYYQDQITEFQDYELGWEVEVDGTAEVVGNYAVISLPTYSNLGGAHPNHHTSIANFNLNTGKEINFMDFVKDVKAFKELAQKRFIEARISDYDLSNVDINDFFFGEGFQLPENFAVKKEGIFFYYNPYEAAPYALGTTEFTISFTDLEGIVKL